MIVGLQRLSNSRVRRIVKAEITLSLYRRRGDDYQRERGCRRSSLLLKTDRDIIKSLTDPFFSLLSSFPFLLTANNGDLRKAGARRRRKSLIHLNPRRPRAFSSRFRLRSTPAKPKRRTTSTPSKREERIRTRQRGGMDRGPWLDEIGDGEVDHTSHPLLNNLSTLSCGSFDELLGNTRTCTHTHTCNLPGPAATSHTHTCYHTHTKVFAADEENREGEKDLQKPIRKPLGNKEAVRKYREKRKAHEAYLEEEVRKLRYSNQQLLRRVQGQAVLEAEILKLRSLLVDLRAKIDADLCVCPSQRPCNGGSLRCFNSQSIVEKGEVVGWEGSFLPTVFEIEPTSIRGADVEGNMGQ
ncbi:hypothetical protein HPP92_010987 [Vanilla planifolia]|uniref:BZIP domain-containing protein n=1 Tax=Vanilla planifolia TaxID=51239 RepID=A0A835V324_VANPL|nr:hypothetical protein HPP92_010987 [Vanilla planifolia]